MNIKSWFLDKFKKNNIKQLEEKSCSETLLKKSWELTKTEKDIIKGKQLNFLDIKKYDLLYKKSIILIGPSGAGKSTVAEELKKKTNMPRLCLDSIANRFIEDGTTKKFANKDEFCYFLVSRNC